MTKFETAVLSASLSNIGTAYWFSTMPGTTGPEWLGLLIVLGYLDYILLLVRYRRGEDG